MLIIKVKPGEKIEYALKRYKNKVRKTKLMNEVKNRKEFTKKSVKIRQQKIKAAYIQAKKDEEQS